jgi:hypothetical protein
MFFQLSNIFLPYAFVDNEDVDGRHSSAFGNSSSSGRHSAGQVNNHNGDLQNDTDGLPKDSAYFF